MLQRGRKGPHVPLVQVAPMVPSPLEQFLLMAPERVTTQPGSPRVNKTSCCFSAAESSGKGWDVPGRWLWAAHPPCTATSSSFTPQDAAAGGPSPGHSKVGFADFLP